MIHKKIGSMCMALLLAIVGFALVGCDAPITGSKSGQDSSDESQKSNFFTEKFVPLNQAAQDEYKTLLAELSAQFVSAKHNQSDSYSDETLSSYNNAKNELSSRMVAKYGNDWNQSVLVEKTTDNSRTLIVGSGSHYGNQWYSYFSSQSMWIGDYDVPVYDSNGAIVSWNYRYIHLVAFRGKETIGGNDYNVIYYFIVDSDQFGYSPFNISDVYPNGTYPYQLKNQTYVQTILADDTNTYPNPSVGQSWTLPGVGIKNDFYVSQGFLRGNAIRYETVTQNGITVAKDGAVFEASIKLVKNYPYDPYIIWDQSRDFVYPNYPISVPTTTTTTSTIQTTSSGSWVSSFNQTNKTASIIGQTGGGGELVFHTEAGYNYRVTGSLRLYNGQAIPGGGGCQILYPGNQIEANTTWTPFDITFVPLSTGAPFRFVGWGPTAGGLEISNLVITKLSATTTTLANFPRVMVSTTNPYGESNGWTYQTGRQLVKDPQQPYAATVWSATIQGSGSGSGEIIYGLNPNGLGYVTTSVPSPYKYLISGNLITSGIGTITASFATGSNLQVVSTNQLDVKIPFTFVFSTGSFAPTFTASGSGTVRAQLTDLRFCKVENVTSAFSRPTGTNIGGYSSGDSNNFFINSSKAETYATFIPNSYYVGKKITVQGSIGKYGSTTTSGSFSPATNGSFIYASHNTQTSFSSTRFCTNSGFTGYYSSPYTSDPQNTMMKLLGVSFFAYLME